MVEVSKEEIIKLAKMSGIELEKNEASELQQDIIKILDYVNQLNELDVENVQPTYQVTDLNNVWREDVVQESPASKEVLLNLAPENKDNFFMATSDFAIELQSNGFQAYYKDDKFVYFKLDDKLIKYLAVMNGGE